MTGPEAVARLIGVGVLWMGVHCAGMCGPVLLGLDVGGHRAGVSLLGGAWRTVLYQLGKGVVYAVLGAIAGALGHGLDAFSERAGGVLAVVVGVVGVASVFDVWGRLGRRRGGLQQIGGSASLLDSLGRRTIGKVLLGRIQPVVRGVMASRHPLRPFFLGLVLAFLPCMIVLWALSLAALTASPVWGAVVMLTLTATTTPLLVLTSASLRLVQQLAPRLRSVVQRGLALTAALWLVAIGLAGLGVIDHRHVPLTFHGKSYQMMLF